MTVRVGKLQKVSLREIWPDEARGFTRWLAENVDLLGEVLGVRLFLENREVDVGPFAVDIMAADDRGGIVVVENQLEKTDHDHLGKLLTYMVNLGAKTGVWIAVDPRPEHAKVVGYLNEVTPPTPRYTWCVSRRTASAIHPRRPCLRWLRGLAKRLRPRAAPVKNLPKGTGCAGNFGRNFWTGSGQGAFPCTLIFHPRWTTGLSTGAGRSGLSYVYRITRDWAAAELYIDRGPGGEQETGRIFEKLHAKKEGIEQEFGGPLAWDRVEGRRARIVRAWLDIGGLKDRERWPEIQDAMIDAMARLHKALRQLIQEMQ